MRVDKECAICGIYFQTDNPQRKYCDDCSSHTKMRKREYAAGLAQSYRRMQEPSVFEITCDKCGKKLKVTFNCLLKAYDEHKNRYVFCCENHRNQWKEEHAVCACCGRPMLGTGRYNPNSNHPQYCSEECAEHVKWEAAKKEGIVRTCLHCKKEVIRRSGGIFCSTACMNAAKADGWKPAKPKKVLESERLITRRETCPRCGQSFLKTHKGTLPAYGTTLCEKCSNLYKIKIQAKNRA